MKVAKNFKKIFYIILYYKNQMNQKCEYGVYKEIISIICLSLIMWHKVYINLFIFVFTHIYVILSL